MRPGTIAVFASLLLILPFAARAGDLPDPTLTPGVWRTDLTLQQICATDWGKDERMVTEKMKDQVMAEYHMTPASCPSGKIEIDHLVSRELGGADDVKNLWPQCYEAPVDGKKPSEVAEMGAHKKDRLENDLGKRICLAPTDPMFLGLDAARALETSNWITSYVARYGNPVVSAAVGRDDHVVKDHRTANGGG